MYENNATLESYSLLVLLIPVMYFRSLLDSVLAGKDVAILINNVAEFQHVEFADTSPETIFR